MLRKRCWTDGLTDART